MAKFMTKQEWQELLNFIADPQFRKNLENLRKKNHKNPPNNDHPYIRYMVVNEKEEPIPHLNLHLDLSYYLASPLLSEYIQIGDSEVAELAEALKKNPDIISLDLSHNQIGPDGASILAQLTTVERLDLHQNPIGRGIVAFAGATQLLVLNLSSCSIHQQDIMDFCKEMNNSETQLSTLNLEDFITEILSLIPMLRALANIESLQSLDLSRNLIGDAGFLAFRRHKNLKKLALSHCLISAEGVNQFFKENFTLEELTIHSPLPTKFLEKMSELIKNSSLNCLNLSGPLLNTGIEMIAESIPRITLRNAIIDRKVIESLLNNPNFTSQDIDLFTDKDDYLDKNRDALAKRIEFNQAKNSLENHISLFTFEKKYQNNFLFGPNINHMIFGYAGIKPAPSEEQLQAKKEAFEEALLNVTLKPQESQQKKSNQCLIC